MTYRELQVGDVIELCGVWTRISRAEEVSGKMTFYCDEVVEPAPPPPAPSDGLMRPWRCNVTGNPVGTDTHRIGAPPCDCNGCRAASRITELEARVAYLERELKYQEVLAINADGERQIQQGRGDAALEQVRALREALDEVFLCVSYINIHGIGEQPEPTGLPQPLRVSFEELWSVINHIGDTARTALAHTETKVLTPARHLDEDAKPV